VPKGTRFWLQLLRMSHSPNSKWSRWIDPPQILCGPGCIHWKCGAILFNNKLITLLGRAYPYLEDFLFFSFLEEINEGESSILQLILNAHPSISKITLLTANLAPPARHLQHIHHDPTGQHNPSLREKVSSGAFIQFCLSLGPLNYLPSCSGNVAAGQRGLRPVSWLPRKAKLNSLFLKRRKCMYLSALPS
jgi:hypothetical protein